MTVVTKFTDLIVWQKSHQLTLSVYKLTLKYPKFEVFGLASQTQRCAVSQTSNLVEGFKRRTRADSVHFYNIAEGSLEELEYQLLLARDLTYIKQKEYESTLGVCEDVGRLLNKWKRSQL